MSKIRVDFDIPSYMRLPMGLCIVSHRLAHMLPEADEDVVDATSITEEGRLEPVVINRPFLSQQVAAPSECSGSSDDQAENIKGEFIPADEPEPSYALEDQGECDPSSEEHQKAVELSFNGKTGESVTGIHGGAGYANYRFNKLNARSFYLRVGAHIIWGADLKHELARTGVNKGDKIKVTFVGKTPVTVLKQDKRKKETDWVKTFRNLWKIELVN